MIGSEPGVPFMPIEIAYCGGADQTLLCLQVPHGTTVAQAIQGSGLLARYPEIDLAVNRMGVFGVLCGPGDVLEPGDRVEVYRPLLADPKHARRRRALARG